MVAEETDLPIYIYVSEFSKGKYHHFEGDFCKGRNPTKKDLEIFSEHRILNIGSQHFIAGLRNPLYCAEIIGTETKHKDVYSFPTLDSLIFSAIDSYMKEGYTSGLILGFDGKNPLPDRVLIVGGGGNKTEEEFLREAQKNNMWVKMLGNIVHH